MAESKIKVVSGRDQTVASINHGVDPPSASGLGKLKDLDQLNAEFEKFSHRFALERDRMSLLDHYVKSLGQTMKLYNKHWGELVKTSGNSDASLLPVSSGMRDLSLAKLQDQQERQDIKPTKRRLSQAATKQPNPDPLESNQTKQHKRSRITGAKSAKIRKM